MQGITACGIETLRYDSASLIAAYCMQGITACGIETGNLLSQTTYWGLHAGYYRLRY